MFNKKVLLATLALTLIGCVTTYKDPRSSEEQKESFNNAMKVLWGDYRVVDSRNNDGKFIDISVHQKGDSVFVEFVDSRVRVMTINGGKCTSGFRPQDNYAYFFFFF